MLIKGRPYHASPSTLNPRATTSETPLILYAACVAAHFTYLSTSVPATICANLHITLINPTHPRYFSIHILTMQNSENEWKQGWKPTTKRPTSTVARNFMTELDSLFKLDGDVDSLDRNLLEKYVVISSSSKLGPSDALQEASCHNTNARARGPGGPPARGRRPTEEGELQLTTTTEGRPATKPPHRRLPRQPFGPENRSSHGTTLSRCATNNALISLQR